MSGATPPLPQYAFMAWCSVKAQGQLYLLSISNSSKVRIHLQGYITASHCNTVCPERVTIITGTIMDQERLVRYLRQKQFAHRITWKEHTKGGVRSIRWNIQCSGCDDDAVNTNCTASSLFDSSSQRLVNRSERGHVTRDLMTNAFQIGPRASSPGLCVVNLFPSVDPNYATSLG
jgi:hypothetical protein